MTEAWVRYLLMGVKKGEKKGEVNEIDPGDSALGWPHDVFKRQHRGAISETFIDDKSMFQLVPNLIGEINSEYPGCYHRKQLST